MAATLRASAAGLQRVDQVRRAKGWTKTEQAWCDLVPTTASTLKRFWRGEAIQQDAFEGICQAVGIEDCQAIVEDSSPELPAPPTHSLSSIPSLSTYDETTWVGRDSLIQTLSNKLQKHCRILMLTGLTGIGKTALAERLAVDAIEENSLPFHFCNLSFDEVQKPEFTSGARQLLQEKLKVNLPKEELNDAALLMGRLVQMLKAHPYWLQLDSLEVLLSEDEQGGNHFVDELWLNFFRQLLTADCPSRCVLTSQDLPGKLKTLGSRYPKFWYCQSLQGLTETEQLELFEKTGIDLATDTELTYLKQIGKAYEGHPLVLQVIAGEMLTEFQAEVRRYWQRYQAELEHIEQQPTHIGPARRSRELEHIVRERVRQSLQRLPTSARQMLCASSVYCRPVRVDFWLAMLGNMPKAQQQAAFDTLQDRYWVEWEGDLLRQHNLTRSVAYDLLRLNAAAWQAAERTAAHLWRTAYQPDPDVSNLEQVRGYLEAFHHCCEVEDWQEAKEILLARLDQSMNYEFHRQLEIWGYYPEQIRLYNKLLNQLNPQTDVICLRGLGAANYNLSHYDQATEYFQQSLSLAREIGDCQGEWKALGNLGIVHLRLGNLTETIEYLQQGLMIARELGDRHGEGLALGNLGVAYLNLANYPQAIEYYQQHLTIARELGDRHGEGLALGNLGVAYLNLANYPQAIEYCQQYLTIAREIGNREGEGLALGNLGVACLSLGNYPQTIEYCQQSLTIRREIGDRFGEGVILGGLGVVHQYLGNYPQAIEYYQQSLTITRDIGNLRGEGTTLGNLGGAYHALGHYTQAIEYHQQSLTIGREIGDRQGEGNVLGELGETCHSLGHYTQAIEYHQQSLTIKREIGDRQGEGYALGGLGSADYALGNYPQAIEYHQQHLTMAREIGDRRGEGIALENLGRTLIKLERYPEALELLQAALELNREIGHRSAEASTLKQLAELYYEIDQFDLARQFCKQALAIATELGIPLAQACRELQLKTK